jgi:hypothetical protein
MIVAIVWIIVTIVLAVLILSFVEIAKAHRIRIEIKDVNPRIRPHTKWRHYKGGVYTVVAVGHDSETKAPVVVYADNNGEVWVRPVSMWFEKVDGGKCRFEEVR